MEPSPLTQQSRPETFQQKIVELYEVLFKVGSSVTRTLIRCKAKADTVIQEDDDAQRPEGFWREFFLLRPDQASLQRILGDLSADDLLQLHVCADSTAYALRQSSARC